MFSKPDFTKTTHTHARTLITHLDGMCRLNHRRPTIGPPESLSHTIGFTLYANKPDLVQIQQTRYFEFISNW